MKIPFSIWIAAQFIAEIAASTSRALDSSSAELRVISLALFEIFALACGLYFVITGIRVVRVMSVHQGEDFQTNRGKSTGQVPFS